MKVELSYLGRSQVTSAAEGLSLSFAPNLSRGKVFFDGEVRNPVRYREAMSALHAVVISDLRFEKRSGSEAYKEYLAEQKRQEQAVHTAARDASKARDLEQGPGAPPPDLERRFRELHRKYWAARNSWTSDLLRNDPAMWRALAPCDPVITVAPDVVFFEGFAKDESSYGCLLVDRDAFSAGAVEGLGTTNVDYSMALYQSIQTLRSYRPTRLSVDPRGFDVKVEGLEDYREEKIDLPPSWLRGFGQISAAMSLPSRTVSLDPGTVYAILGYLKVHREKKGPRAISFELTPGKPARLVLEPWNVVLEAKGAPYHGPRPEVVKVWGRRRLLALARLLPLAERIDVRLLGTGMPTLWTAHLGDMRFILGLSGWTKNDWTNGAALDLLAGIHVPDALLASKLAEHLSRARRAKLEELVQLGGDRAKVLAALHLLAKQGQVIFDFAHDVVRYRPILSVGLSEELIGPEHPELIGAKELITKHRRAKIGRDTVAAGLRLVAGSVGDRDDIEVALDADGVIRKGRCACSYYYTNRLRQGPCRHILVLRMTATGALGGESSRFWS